MITFLVDTDWLVDYLKGKEDPLKLLSPLLDSGNLATSIIVYGEIYEGLLETAVSETYQKAFADVLEGVPAIGLDTPTAQVFARNRVKLRRQGQPIPDHDLWIAATPYVMI